MKISYTIKIILLYYKNMDFSLDKKKDNRVFDSTKDFLMYFQTSIRNVALTTAVSFAAAGYSRFYRGKSKLYSVGMLLISFLLLTISFTLNNLLRNHLLEYKDEINEIENWLIINNIFMVVHFIIIFFALYTIYRLATGNSFN